MTDEHEFHDHERVETAWKQRLGRAGLEESTASALIAELQASPALTAGAPSGSAARDAVRRAIDRTPFERYGIDRPAAVRRDLRRALDAGLDGRLDGPVALQTPAGEPRYAPTDRVRSPRISADPPGAASGGRQSAGAVSTRSGGSRAAGVARASSDGDPIVDGGLAALLAGGETRSEVVDAIRQDLQATVDAESVGRADLVIAASLLTSEFDGADVEPPVSELVGDFERLVALGIRPAELVAAIETLE